MISADAAGNSFCLSKGSPLLSRPSTHYSSSCGCHSGQGPCWHLKPCSVLANGSSRPWVRDGGREEELELSRARHTEPSARPARVAGWMDAVRTASRGWRRNGSEPPPSAGRQAEPRASGDRVAAVPGLRTTFRRHAGIHRLNGSVDTAAPTRHETDVCSSSSSARRSILGR